MPCWIFKVADQESYPDVPGRKYVYDNTHSVRVMRDDVFVYLDKRGGKYAFSATGAVSRITSRRPTKREARRTSKVRTVFSAHLMDVVWFAEPMTISLTTKIGRRNRARLGITDVNLMGWSQSMPRLGQAMYASIMDLAEADGLLEPAKEQEADYSVQDSWGQTKIRHALSRFAENVLARHKRTCVVCGSQLEPVLDAAHLSPYASDVRNRANPGNGVCVCVFCHRALDRRLIAICPTGELLVSRSITDPVALDHFGRVSGRERRSWLAGVEPAFLGLTVKLYEAGSPDA